MRENIGDDKASKYKKLENQGFNKETQKEDYKVTNTKMKNTQKISIEIDKKS